VPRSWLPTHRTTAAEREAVVSLRRNFRQMGFEANRKEPSFTVCLWHGACPRWGVAIGRANEQEAKGAAQRQK